MIYLCIPAHNEEQTVGPVLWKIRQVMAELQRDYQLLVADDASTDRTLEVLEPYMRVLPLTVFRNAERRGYAASLEMLVREAVARSDYPKRDIVITLQADFTDEPGHVATLVKRMESGADIVASNALPAASSARVVRWRRALLNALVRSLGWPDDVRDPLNGFNAFRVLCLKRALDERKDQRLLRTDGWAANAQLLSEAAPHARRIDAVEVRARPERLQRTSRFLFMPMLRQVLALRRGRESGTLLPLGVLAPSSVMGGPSSQRSLVAESLREAAREDRSSGGDAKQRQARSGRQQRGQRAAARAGRGEAQRTAERNRTATGDAAPRQSRRTGRGGAESAAPPEGEAQATRPRRGRRGGAGRKRKRNGADVRPVLEIQDAGSPAAEGDGPPAAQGAGEGEAVESAGGGGAAEPTGTRAEGAAPRKRRRGGRGRRRGTGTSASGADTQLHAEADATAPLDAEADAPASPPLDQPTSKAS